jgi:hypothetical protein
MLSYIFGNGKRGKERLMLNNKAANFWNVIKVSVLLTIGAAIIIFIAIESVNSIQVMTGRGRTTARVISTSDEEREYEDGHRVAIVTVAEYEFVVDSRKFYGKTEVSQNSLSEGDQLTIQFNPSDPSKNRVRGDRKVLADLLLMYLVGGIFAYIVIKIAISKLPSLKAPKSPH